MPEDIAAFEPSEQEQQAALELMFARHYADDQYNGDIREIAKRIGVPEEMGAIFMARPHVVAQVRDFLVSQCASITNYKKMLKVYQEIIDDPEAKAADRIKANIESKKIYDEIVLGRVPKEFQSQEGRGGILAQAKRAAKPVEYDKLYRKMLANEITLDQAVEEACDESEKDRTKINIQKAAAKIMDEHKPKRPIGRPPKFKISPALSAKLKLQDLMGGA